MIDPQTELAYYAREKCEAAFRRVVDHFGGLVFNSALRRLHDHDLAEETAQTVFAHLARKAAQVSQYRSISAWLFETTRRESAKSLRSHLRHQRRLTALSASNPSATMTEEPDQELRDLLPHLEASLDSLKPGERQILLARFFDNQSFPGIAASTGKSESACKMSLRRSLEKLRIRLSSKGITYSAVTLGTLLQTEWAKAAPIPAVSPFAAKAMETQPTGWTASLPGSVTFPKVLIFTAITFLGIACHQIFQKQKGELPESADSRSKIAEKNSINGVGKDRFSTRERSRQAGRKQTHKAKDLNFFYLPSTDLKNTTLKEAANAIIARYQTVCEETGEIALPLTVKIEGENRSIKNLHLSSDKLPMSFEKIAFVSGKRFRRQGEQLLFSEIPETRDGQVETCKFLVPPTFLTWFKIFLSEQLPDSIDQDLQEMPQLNPTFVFRKAGILADNESATFETHSSELRIVAGTKNMARMEILTELAKKAMPLQIRFHVWLELNGERTSLPHLIAIPGQPATLEIGKEYLEKNNDEVITAWVGHRLELTSELFGLGERTILNYSHMAAPTDEKIAKYEASGKLDDLGLEEFRIKEEVIIRPAEDRWEGIESASADVEDFGLKFEQTDRQGNKQSLRIWSERIDATGRRLEQR